MHFLSVGINARKILLWSLTNLGTQETQKMKDAATFHFVPLSTFVSFLNPSGHHVVYERSHSVSALPENNWHLLFL